MSSIDILYFGPLNTDDRTDVQALLDVGKAPLGWIGEFTPSFLLPFIEFSLFPAGIAMYSQTLNEEQLRKELPKARFVLELPSNSQFLNGPEMVALLRQFPNCSVIKRKDFSSLDELLLKIIPVSNSTLASQGAMKMNNSEIKRENEVLTFSSVLSTITKDFNFSNFQSIKNQLENNKLVFPRTQSVAIRIDEILKEKT